MIQSKKNGKFGTRHDEGEQKIWSERLNVEGLSPKQFNKKLIFSFNCEKLVYSQIQLIIIFQIIFKIKTRELH
jgi:hypothetical protein